MNSCVCWVLQWRASSFLEFWGVELQCKAASVDQSGVHLEIREQLQPLGTLNYTYVSIYHAFPLPQSTDLHRLNRNGVGESGPNGLRLLVPFTLGWVGGEEFGRDGFGVLLKPFRSQSGRGSDPSLRARSQQTVQQLCTRLAGELVDELLLKVLSSRVTKDTK